MEEIHPFSGISNCVLGTDVRARRQQAGGDHINGPSPAILYLAGGRGRLDRALARSLSLVTLHVHACNTRSVGIKKQTAARPPTRAMGQGRRPGTPSARPSRNDRQCIMMPHAHAKRQTAASLAYCSLALPLQPDCMPDTP